MLLAFRDFIRKHQLLSPTDTTLLAVSGGIDSVVMCALFSRTQLRFAVAHANFKLRGQESEEDEAFVKALAQQYGVTYYAQSFDVLSYAQEHALSTQMAARELRYRWLDALCGQHDIKQFATAHHWNDSIETVLLNLTKGTSIAGLHGILPRRGRCIRPLLFADKAAIVQYAQAEKLAWREDSSNKKDAYQRNIIRNQVIPKLKSINPSLESTTRQTIARLTQVEVVFDAYVAMVKEQVWKQEGTDYYLAVRTIQDQIWAPVVLFALLKPLGFSFVQVSDLLQQRPASGAIISSASHQLCVDREQWIISPRTVLDDVVYTLQADTSVLDMPYHSLRCTHVPSAQHRILPDHQVASLDRARLQFPLQVRRWQPGDYFYPLGMQGRKKVSDFLIDIKVPRLLKERTYVITSAGQIVWVVGYRIDDRFKVTERTEHVVILRQERKR
ncbi:MAG: tRNA lysidine(34) synthetase TilS [Bacteroidota bacterium]